MAYIYDEPLNNRSGIGGKEKLQREHALKEDKRSQEKLDAAYERVQEEERKHDKLEANEKKESLT